MNQLEGAQSNSIITLPRAWDKWIIAISFGVIIFCSYQLYNLDFQSGNKSSDQIALDFKPSILNSDVRIRHQQQLAWNKLNYDSIVYQKDQIFTGTKSWVTLQDSLNNKIQLGPNTLVELSFVNKSPEIFVKQGFIKTQVQRQDVKIKTSTNEFLLKAKSAEKTDIELSLDHKGALNVKTSEDISIVNQSTGLEDNLAAHSQLTVTNDKKEIINSFIRLLEPKQNISLILNTLETINFKWESSSDLDQNFKLNIESQSSGKTEYFTTPTPSFNVTNLNFDNYLWWVEATSKTGETVTSLKQQISIKNIKLPKFVSPAQHETLISQDGSSLVFFEWSDALEQDIFEIIISDHNDKEEKIETAFKSIEANLKDGTYTARLFVRQHHTGKVIEADSLIFTIRSPEQETIESMEIFHEANYFMTTNNLSLNISWTEIKNTDEYMISVYSEKNMSNPQVLTKTNSLESTLEITEPGIYYFKVSASRKNKIIGESNLSKFEVKKLTLPSRPKLKRPSFDLPTESSFKLDLRQFLRALSSVIISPVYAQDLPAGLRIKFEWEKVDNANLYIFELARDRNFNQMILKQKVNTNEFVWASLVTPQKYFWRVKGVERFGFSGPYSEVGEIQTFDIKLKAPEIKNPELIDTIVKNQEEIKPEIKEEAKTYVEDKKEQQSLDEHTFPAPFIAIGGGLTAYSSSQNASASSSSYLKSSSTGSIPHLKATFFHHFKSLYLKSSLQYGQRTVKSSGLADEESINLVNQRFDFYVYKQFRFFQKWLPGVGLRTNLITRYIDTDDVIEKENQIGLGFSLLRSFETSYFKKFEHLIGLGLGPSSFKELGSNYFLNAQLDNIYSLSNKFSIHWTIHCEWEKYTFSKSSSDKINQNNITLSNSFLLGYQF